ncbi:protein kinase [Clostridium perfringens]|nr:protein kinase [Clostridium perfringens]
MEEDNIKSKPSNYEELTELCSNKKSKILLAKSNINNKIYVKKILKVYNKEVYEKLKNLKSINLPKIYEIFEEEGRLIVIEEFINGSTIEDVLKSGKVFDEETALGFMITLCDALEELHSLKPSIIHRDIKPSNVIINNDGILKLIDYDVSRIYKEDKNKDTVILGTVGYASPEQLGFDQTDGRTDIYAMGVLLNVMVVGKHPIEKAIEGQLKDIVSKCTMLIADERYQSVQDLKIALENELNRFNKTINKEEHGLNHNIENTEKVSKKSLNLDKKDFKTTVELLLNRKDDKLDKYEGSSSTEKLDTNKKETLNLEKHEDESEGHEEVNNLKKVNWVRRYVPGFRTNTAWKITLAILGYIFLIFGLTMNLGSGDINLIMTDIIMVFFILAYISLYSNFLGIAKKLPLIKRKRILDKICGYLLYSFLIFIVLGGVLSLFMPPAK